MRSPIKRSRVKPPKKPIRKVSRSKRGAFIRCANKLKNSTAWEQFATYIKVRDGYTCITCGKVDLGPNMHAGHYYQASGHLALFFDELNVHAQCAGCNCFKSGCGAAYSSALRHKYGTEVLDYLDRRSTEYHPGYTRQDLRGLAAKYKEKSC